MPLHDWTKLRGWFGLRIYWMVNICDNIKSKLPPGFRAWFYDSAKDWNRGIRLASEPGRFQSPASAPCRASGSGR